MIASMRPRPDAAENRARRAVVRIAVVGFNEAAARCRGKLGTGVSRSESARPLQ